MDLFNRAYTQLYDAFRSMTPTGRLMVGACAVLLVVAGALVSLREGSSTYVELMHGVPISSTDLPSMAAAFGKANLNRYEIRGTAIFVPQGQEAVYMAALATAKALPKRPGAALYDALANGSFLEAGSQRDVERLKLGRQEYMAQIIREMPGIEIAHILIDEDKPGGFKEKIITASVCVKPVGSSRLDEKTVATIRDLVTGAVAGIKPENIKISDLNEGAKLNTVEPVVAPAAAGEAPTASVSEIALDWACQHWRTLGIATLVLVALVTLRSLIHPRSTTEKSEAAPAIAISQPEEKPAEPPRVPRPHFRRFHEGSRSLGSELAELIERDPDTAASVLRNWIGQVG